MSGMMGGMAGGQSGDSAGGLMDMMKMMPGQGGSSGGASAGASGDAAPNAKIMGFEVPDLVAGGVMGMNKGNAAMAQAAQGGNAPNAGNQGGSAGGMDVSKLIEAFGKKNPESNPESNPELSGQSFDNPTGLTTPDFNNPVGKRKDINLGNYGRQSKPSDMNIDWDNLKL